MSLDHYYTAAVLGKGFGEIAKNSNKKILGGRHWNVPVLNLDNLENRLRINPKIRYEDIISEFNNLELINDHKIIQRLKAEKIFTSGRLIEPENEKIKNLENLIGDKIKSSNNEVDLVLTEENKLIINQLIKELFIKSPIVNDFSHKEYTTEMKTDVGGKFDDLFPSEKIKITAINLQNPIGFIIDTTPIVLVISDLLEKFFSPFLIWFYSPNKCYLITDKTDKTDYSSMARQSDFYFAILRWYFQFTYKYIAVCPKNKFLIGDILDNHGMLFEKRKDNLINFRENFHERDK